MPLKRIQIIILLVNIFWLLMPVSQAATTKIACKTPNMTIPNANPSGVSDILNISPDTGTLNSIKVTGLDISHQHVGELAITLAHNGTSVKLIDLPGDLIPYDYPCFGKNISDMTLDDAAVSAVETSCQGNIPAYPASNAYKPNESLSSFNTQDVNGDWTLTIIDAYNYSQADGTLAKWCLEYTRPNTAVFNFSPDSGTTLNFGDITSTSPNQIIRASNASGDNFLITEVSLAGTNLSDFSLVTPSSSIPPEPTVTVTPGNSYEIKVQCLPKGPGLRTATLTVKTNLDNLPVLTFPLQCNGLVSKYVWDSSNGDPIDFGTPVAVGASSPSKTLTVREKEGFADLNLTNIAITGTDASEFTVNPATLKVDRGNSGTLVVQCTPTGGGLRTATLTFNTDDPSQPSVSYLLRCTGDAPSFSSTPSVDSTLQFNTITVGSTVTKTITVKNTGTATLTLSNPSFTSAGFSLIAPWNLGINIDAGKIHKFQVQCDTTSPAAYSSKLTFSTNDPAQLTAPSYELSCTVADVPTPLYDSSPSTGKTISFGDATVGGGVEKDLTVMEIGNATLKVSAGSPVFTGSHPNDFSIVSSLPLTINDSGTAVKITLKCAPTGIGARSATLNLVATSTADVPVTNIPNPTYTLTCTGKAAGYGSTPVSASGIIDMGSIAVNQTRTYNLNVQETGSAALTVDFDSISGLQASEFSIDTAVTTFPFTIDNSSVKTVKIQCKPSSLGVRTAELRLKSNDVLANPTPTYTLKCTGLEAVGPAYSSSLAAPGGTLDFGSAAIGQTVTQTLTISEVGSSVLSVSKNSPLIDGANASDFGLDSGATSPFAGNNYFDIPNSLPPKTLTLTCAPSTVGALVATLHLKSTDPANPKPTYTLQCQGTPSLIPGYSSTPVAPEGTLDFGSGPVNVAISKMLTIQETGNTDLQVGFSGLGGIHAADFQLTSPTFPLTIADGGAARAVTVVCTPSGEGLRTGLLKLTSNDTANPTPTYTLNCTGTAVVTPVVENITPPPVTGDVTLPTVPVTTGNNDAVTPTNGDTPVTTPSSDDTTTTPVTEDKNASVDLTVVLGGNGKGTVTGAPAGINCHSDKSQCTAAYPVSTAVVLTPQADPNSEFSHWEQTCPDGKIVLDNSTTCTAYFRLVLNALTVSNIGSGTVSSAPNGLFCGNGHDDCTHNFTANETVTLVAIPQAGWQFSQWSGDCTTGHVLMDTDKTCQATFVQIVTVTPAPASPSSTEANVPVISTSVQAIGKGSVTSDPAGIQCVAGTPCTTNFPADTVVTLTATPEPGYTFVGWSGTCNGSQATVAITVDKLANCQAIFAASSYNDPGTPAVTQPIEPNTTVPVTTVNSTTSTSEVATDASSLPRCPTHGEISLACDAQWDEVSEILITPRGYLSNGILIDTLENHGWASNLIVQAGATLTGGVVSGRIDNAGTLSDFEFRGILIEGGILAGIIHNTSRVDGILKDVQLAADTVIHGGKLAGKILGNADAPGHLDNVIITAGSFVDNVIIGTDVKWAADVIFGENVQFVNQTLDDPIAEANQTAQPIGTTTGSVTYLDSNLYISDKTLQGNIQGRSYAPAYLENVTLLPGSSLSHVIIGQNVKNQGTIANFEFRGAILQGGTLAGEVDNTQAGTLKNVHLAANTHVNGGNMQGSIIGDAKAPALLENVTIAAGSYLENVIIGEGTKLPKNVTLGKGVQFVDSATEDEPAAPPASALEITPQGHTVDSPAQFEGKISVCQAEQPNHLLLSRRDAKSIDLATSIVVDPQHVNQPAEIFMVARQRLGKTQKNYMRVGDHWQIWDNDFNSLKPAQAVEKLPATGFVLPLFSGDLSTVRGELTVYVGYQLPEGTLVYDGVDPLHFSIDSSPDSCIVYAVHDGGLNNTQFLKLNLSAGLDGEMQALGPVYPGHDIESLTIDPNNPDVLYATAGNDARVKGEHLKGYVYTVNRKTGGMLTPVGPTGYQQVSGLATHPTEHTLWGWAINYIDGDDKKGVKWMGIILIDPKTGKGTPVKQIPSPIEHDVGGLAWLYDGSKLYAAGGDILWAYDPETQEFTKACDIPEAKDGDIEGLDMQPNGLLLMGIDYQTDNNTTIVAYDPKQCQVVTIKTFEHSHFNDIESIIWPAAECNDLSWLNEVPCQGKNGH